MTATKGLFGRTSALIIVEVVQCHDSSLGSAHGFVDVAAQAGADTVKFQIHAAALAAGTTFALRHAFRL